MKKSLRLTFNSGVALGLVLTSGVALAESAHYLGGSYVSGAKEIWDWHEENLYLDEDSGGIPIGLSYRYANVLSSGMRVDAGVGPVVLIIGDVEYHDIPLQLTIGYSFSQSSNVRPYVRLGASYHISDGDYLKEKAGVGAVGAIGLEIGNPGSPSFFIEAMYDTAQATFSTAQSNSYLVRQFSEKEIAVSDFLLTLGVRF
jgi:hypothetical protein